MVRQAFGGHVRDLLLPLGKQSNAFCADYACRSPFPEGFANPLELSAVSPDLPSVHAPQAFAQYVRRRRVASGMSCMRKSHG
jgi:hypothetical protein